MLLRHDPLSRYNLKVKVIDNSSCLQDETAAALASIRSPHGECVHCWRPLANKVKVQWKCALTGTRASWKNVLLKLSVLPRVRVFYFSMNCRQYDH